MLGMLQHCVPSLKRLGNRIDSMETHPVLK